MNLRRYFGIKLPKTQKLKNAVSKSRVLHSKIPRLDSQEFVIFQVYWKVIAVVQFNDWKKKKSIFPKFCSRVVIWLMENLWPFWDPICWQHLDFWATLLKFLTLDEQSIKK